VTVPTDPFAADVILPYASTVIFVDVYTPGVTVVVAKSKVIEPLLIIGLPEDVILPDVPPTETEVTVPEPPGPFAAVVIRPEASIVIFAEVYGPGITPESDNWTL
jgi:hypothetical protein